MLVARLGHESEVCRDEEIFTPVKEPSRHAKMLHGKEMLPIVLRISGRPVRHAALSEASEKPQLSFEYGVSVLAVAHKFWEQPITVAIKASKPQECALRTFACDFKN